MGIPSIKLLALASELKKTRRVFEQEGAEETEKCLLLSAFSAFSAFSCSILGTRNEERQMKPRSNKGNLAASILTLLLTVASAGFAAEPATSPQPIVAASYVLVTNIVVVTNYVITTNFVHGTSGLGGSRTNRALPDLSWVPPEDGFDWIQLKSGE